MKLEMDVARKRSKMSSENKALINRIYEAFETKNLLALLNLLSPEVHIAQCPEVPWGGIFQGMEAARLFFGRVTTYLDNHVVIDRLIDGSDRIVAVGRTHGTVRSNGRTFDVPLIHLWEFRDGLAVRLEIVIDVPTMQAALVPY